MVILSHKWGLLVVVLLTRGALGVHRLRFFWSIWQLGSLGLGLGILAHVHFRGRGLGRVASLPLGLVALAQVHVIVLLRLHGVLESHHGLPAHLTYLAHRALTVLRGHHLLLKKVSNRTIPGWGSSPGSSSRASTNSRRLSPIPSLGRTSNFGLASRAFLEVADCLRRAAAAASCRSGFATA